MPLRDHFHPPLDNESSWEGLHGGWPMMIVSQLARVLPRRYVAEPRVHSGASVEIDVATYQRDEPTTPPPEAGPGNGMVATAVWTPPRPTFRALADILAQDEYEVRIYDRRRGRRLVAAVEIVSPANKDRPEHRRAFVAKCAALLQNQVAVAIVDLVTTRRFNLYAELLDSLGLSDAWLNPDAPPLYAVACRPALQDEVWHLEAWGHALVIGDPLPTLPLWLANDLAVPLDLEESYEQTCRILRITDSDDR